MPEGGECFTGDDRQGKIKEEPHKLYGEKGERGKAIICRIPPIKQAVRSP
jgi:hypothetical protein